MKLDPETREKAAQDARAAYYPNLTNWDLLSEGGRNLWREIADAVAATIPEPTPADGPRPINPADVRVGDRVRAVTTWDGVITDAGDPDALYMRQDDGGYAFIGPRGDETVLYLLDRPDPDADLIRTLEGIDQSLHGAALDTWGRGFLDALAAAGLTIEPKPEVNHLHA